MKDFDIVADFIKEKDGEILKNVRVGHTKPRVFAFYGAMTVNMAEAVAAIKGTKALFKDMKVEGFEYYSTYYTRKTLLGFLKYERASEAEKEEFRKDFAESVAVLFDEILWPLIQKKGERLSYKEVEKNFRKIVFRGHCMGSLVITNLGNFLVKKMKKLKYSKKEIFDLTYNIRAIFSSSIVLPHEIDANFNIFSFINLGDNELFKYAGFEWKANLLYMTGVRKMPDEPIVKTLKINNLDFVLLSGLFDDRIKAKLDEELEKAKVNNDKVMIRKMEKVLLGHAWSLVPRPYDKNKGVKEAYKAFKELVKTAF